MNTFRSQLYISLIGRISKINLPLLLLSAMAIVVAISCDSKVVGGYTDKISYNTDDTVSAYINAIEEIAQYDISITTINGELIQTISADIKPQKMGDDKPYQNGFGYQKTTSFPIDNLASGVYVIGDKFPFIVKPSEPCDILILYSSNTECAYNNEGGKSTYSYSSSDKKAASIVSFHRPDGLPEHSTEFLKWIEKQKTYSIGYIADVDLEEYKNIESAKLLIIAGHSEYWTRKARRNFDKFVDAGNDALILSGNTMWWQVRYDMAKNQMINYKNKAADPIKEVKLKTITWPDTILAYSVLNSIGLDFNNGGYGQREDKGWDGYKIVSPNHQILANTGLVKNDIIKLDTDEYDGAKLIFSEDSTKVELDNMHNFYKYDLIGYDVASRFDNANGAWIVMQKTKDSGTIINVGSSNWCAKSGIEGEDSKLIKQVTLNMIDFLLD